jgi:ABC-type multidrug transport system fused ATPase/permease subunit
MRDHRGQRVRMRKIDRRFFRSMVFGRARSEYAKRVRRRYWRVSILLALIAFLCFTVPSMLLIVMLLSPLSDILFALPIKLMGKVMMFVNLAGTFGGMLLGFSVLFSGYFFLQRRIMADLLAANGYCGSCSYSISEVTPEPDGCTVCPECSSAWRCHE